MANSYKITKVIWKDATHFPEWHSAEDILALEPILCHSVGYLIHEDDKTVYLAAMASQCPHEDTWSFTDILVIPRGCVLGVVS